MSNFGDKVTTQINALVKIVAISIIVIGAAAVISIRTSDITHQSDVKEYLVEDVGLTCEARVWVRGYLTKVSTYIDPREEVCEVSIYYEFVPYTQVDSWSSARSGCDSEFEDEDVKTMKKEPRRQSEKIGGATFRNGNANSIIGIGSNHACADECSTPLPK